MIPPLEFEDLMVRVKYVEEKMGIESVNKVIHIDKFLFMNIIGDIL